MNEIGELYEFVLTGENNLSPPNFVLDWYDVNVHGGVDKTDIITFKCGHKMYVGDNQLDYTSKSNLPSILLVLNCQCGCEIYRCRIMGSPQYGTPFSSICWYESLSIYEFNGWR